MSIDNTVQIIFWICWTASKDTPFNAEYRILKNVLFHLLRVPTICLSTYGPCKGLLIISVPYLMFR